MARQRRQDTGQRVHTRGGHAAFGWSLLFAALSFYWALGGELGAGTIGAGIEDLALARDPVFVAVLWVTAVLKLLAAVLALALARAWGDALPRWTLLTAGWGAAALLVLYGLANTVQHLLMATGVLAVPAGLGRGPLRWHLSLWDPVWLLGGLVFTVAAWQYTTRARGRRQAAMDDPARCAA